MPNPIGESYYLGPNNKQRADYLADHGTITFVDQERVKTITVTVHDDYIYEYPDESFNVTLSNLRYSGLALESNPNFHIGSIPSTQVVIQDNGDAGTLYFKRVHYEQREEK